MNKQISIDDLIDIVKTGGKIKTGVDVYNSKGVLLLDKDVLVEKVKILEFIKENAIQSIPVNTAANGGIWDEKGDLINETSSQEIADPAMSSSKIDTIYSDIATNQIEMRLLEIEEIKEQAAKKYTAAKNSVKKVLTDIKRTGGEFDYDEVESSVSKLVDFLVVSNNPFSYLTQEIFSY
ncbi:MAG: metal-dependent phosphohydrolase, partial [Desulfobacula sp.]|nr:metal-dependent phosphohydrolase [Desulfobacula sp.]